MIQSIVDGISIKISEAFGDDYKIHTESVKQGLKEPCFFIQLASSASKQEIGNRFFRENLFCIHYFPASKSEPKAECYVVQDKLLFSLRYIKVADSWRRGTGMHGEFVDGILNFFVNFNMFVLITEEQALIEELKEINMATKG